MLIRQGEGLGTVGCGIGLAIAAYMMFYYVQRIKDTPYDPLDWPGAKVWPAGMSLITFFELMATFQGLRDGLGLLSEP